MSLSEALLQQHGVWRGGMPGGFSQTIPTGYAELATELPGGGWPVGALTELLGLQEGIGELQLVLPALAKLTAAGKRVVWLAPPHVPYAPALVAAGLDLAHLAVIRAPGRRDALWAAEQVLRAGPCHALLAWFHHARYDELRRLAVAAEASQAFVALFRPAEAAREPSPATLRVALEASENHLLLNILKRRGRLAEAPIQLPVNRPVHALGRPAFPAAAARNARAPRRLGLPVHA
ncbi:MAG TPA: translesion DNA synthesis-associated protein ImuA [Burkholderiales bacterium]|nr:translesion DNA synthesis-associated protein ImuA [Burkholderiales bacterium]